MELTRPHSPGVMAALSPYAMSSAIHVAAAFAMYAFAVQQAERAANQTIEFAVLEAQPEPPPPPPEPEPPPPEPPKPKPDAPKPKPPPKPTEPPPPPPPSNTKEAPPPTEPVKPVFGVSMASVTAAGTGGFAIAVGNTTMMAPTKDFTPPSEVKEYSGGQVTPQAPKLAAVQPVKSFKVEKQPVLQSSVKPKYTEEARKAEIEGQVVLRLTISAQGNVVNAKLLKGLGYGLDELAVASAKQLLFAPAVMDGQPVATEITFKFTFELED